jgi:hypothetical protein
MRRRTGRAAHAQTVHLRERALDGLPTAEDLRATPLSLFCPTECVDAESVCRVAGVGWERCDWIVCHVVRTLGGSTVYALMRTRKRQEDRRPEMSDMSAFSTADPTSLGGSAPIPSCVSYHDDLSFFELVSPFTGLEFCDFSALDLELEPKYLRPPPTLQIQ